MRSTAHRLGGETYYGDSKARNAIFRDYVLEESCCDAEKPAQYRHNANEVARYTTVSESQR